MSNEPSGRRGRRRGLVALVVVIFIVLLVEAAVVTAVFVSPTASATLEEVAASADRAWQGTDNEPGLRARSARAARGAYEEWLVPLWRGPQAPTADPEFTACVDCHPNYARERAFTVYMNHPLHAEIGMRCETCHPQNPHPNPPRPTEAMCADCHDEVLDQESCGSCHPPGSLPHFYLLGAPRGAVVRCDVCHPKGAFEASGTESLIGEHVYTGGEESVCLSCHEDTTCAYCHAPGHPTGFIETHGETVGRNGAISCNTCHTQQWCADQCHAVTQTNPFVPRPLPTPGVRP